MRLARSLFTWLRGLAAGDHNLPTEAEVDAAPGERDECRRRVFDANFGRDLRDPPSGLGRLARWLDGGFNVPTPAEVEAAPLRLNLPEPPTGFWAWPFDQRRGRRERVARPRHARHIVAAREPRG